MRVCVPPPQEALQAPQADQLTATPPSPLLALLHDAATVQVCDWLVAHRPPWVRRGHRVLVRTRLPRPQVTEQADHSLHSVAVMSAASSPSVGVLGVERMSVGQAAGQCPHSPVPTTWLPPASVKVEHHGFPSVSWSVVQLAYTLSRKRKGNRQGLPLLATHWIAPPPLPPLLVRPTRSLIQSR